MPTYMVVLRAAGVIAVDAVQVSQTEGMSSAEPILSCLCRQINSGKKGSPGEEVGTEGPGRGVMAGRVRVTGARYMGRTPEWGGGSGPGGAGSHVG